MMTTTMTEEASTTRRLAVHDEQVAHVVGAPDGLHFCFLSGGHLHAVRDGSDLLVNLLLGCPLAGSLQRLYVEFRQPGRSQVVPVIGPGSAGYFRAGERSAEWLVEEKEVTVRAVLTVDSAHWRWKLEVDVAHARGDAVEVRVLHGIDVGIAPQGAARNNEAYTSQYIDHRVLRHPVHGMVVASRQNLAVDGRHPVLLQGCLQGVDSVATDGFSVFGGPAMREEMPGCSGIGGKDLPGVVQGELSYVAQMSSWLSGGIEGALPFVFVGQLVADHPAPTGDQDLVMVEDWRDGWEDEELVGDRKLSPEGMMHAPLVVHGEHLGEEEIDALVPGDWDVVERGPDGELWSFFAGEDSRHVVTRAKEEVNDRSHATILRSGRADYVEQDLLTTTCGMAGVFNSLMSIGHPSFHRVLSFPREPHGLRASAGQRVWIAGEECWELLGVASLFEMGLGHCRWIYELAERTIEVRVSVNPDAPHCRTGIRVLRGEPVAMMVTHGLIGGAAEYDAPSELEVHLAEGRAVVRTAADAEGAFAGAWEVRALGEVARVGGGEILPGGSENAAMFVVETGAVSEFAVDFGPEVAEPVVDPSREFCLEFTGGMRVGGVDDRDVERLDRILPWWVHNGLVHLTVPHGLEQYNGGAWGTRDVTQGSVELLLVLGRHEACRRIIREVYRHQSSTDFDWPQWFMLAPFAQIRQEHSHGDIPLWPLKALCDYLEATEDFAVLEEPVGWNGGDADEVPLWEHVAANVEWLCQHCIPGTALLRYGDGDWNDSLQPTRPEYRERLVSSWSVALSYQVLRRLEELCRRSGRTLPGLEGFADAVRADFGRYLVIDGVVCGFYLFDGKQAGPGQPLLHPKDCLTGISYRLLPMTRSMIGGLFDPDQAEAHLELIREHLLAADGARLMDEAPEYRGGTSEIFQRAEQSPCFGREIGLFYTHAHLRYIEALARLGKAEELWEAVGQINPAGLGGSVPHALPRQANAYFSSSDADVATRYEAAERYEDIKAGKVPVKGGWRIYSSGPGIILNLVVTRMLGIRREYDAVVLDPVLPKSLNGLEFGVTWEGVPLKVVFSVRDGCHTPRKVVLNGAALDHDGLTENPYRDGGWRMGAAAFKGLLRESANMLEVTL